MLVVDISAGATDLSTLPLVLFDLFGLETLCSAIDDNDDASLSDCNASLPSTERLLDNILNERRFGCAASLPCTAIYKFSPYKFWPVDRIDA